MHVLPYMLPWYVTGPCIGLIVAAFFAISNRTMGGSAAYIQFTDATLGQPVKEWWRTWFLWGILGGGFLAGLLRGGSPSLHYGVLGRVLPLPALVVVLFAGGLLMGYGARWAGGCTSGHGLCGVASRSAGSLVATMCFFGAAVALTLAVHALTGGRL